MTQADIQDAVLKATESVNTAFWATSNDAMRDTLSGIHVGLDALSGKITQEDLASRSQDLAAAAETLKSGVLPGVMRLGEQVKSMTEVEDHVKTALADAMQVAESVTFFAIPAIPV